MRSTDGLVETARQVLAASGDENLTMMAAGLAYYAFNSLIPAMLLALAGVAYFGALPEIAPVLGTTTGTSPGAITKQLQQAVGEGEGQTRAVVIAGLIFLWSSGRLFDSIRSAFEEVYGVSKSNPRLGYVLDVAVAFTTVAIAFVMITALGFALSAVVSGVLLWLATPLLLVAALFVLFFPMYYLFPAASVDAREAAPGAAFAAVAWAISGVGFRLYATTSQSVQLYGVAGGLLLLLTLFYVGGFTLLLGVTLNGVVAGRIDPG